MTAGNHSFKWGGDVNFVKDIINNLRFFGGEFNYTGATTGIADFIVDYVNFQTNGAIRALSNGTADTDPIGRCLVYQRPDVSPCRQVLRRQLQPGLWCSRLDDEDHRS